MHNKLYEMFNKIGETTKKFIKNNYKILIIDIIIISLFLIPTGYDVYSPGSLLDLSKKIEIEDAYKKEGTINATYVTSRNGTLFFYLMGKIIPSWDIKEKSDITLEGEEYNEAVERQKLAMNGALSNAIILAYNKSNNTVKINSKKIFVLAKTKESLTDLKVGDQILKIDNKKIKSQEDIKKYLKTKKIDDKIKIEIKRNKKIKIIEGQLINNENEASIGVYLQETYKLSTKPKIKTNTDESESGPSAGLMSALYIYNVLNKMDITKGLTVSGTGTIDINGKVGEIDGIKYKLAGAVKKGADVFICPKGNYEEAIKEQEKHNYEIKIIEVETFDQALKELSKL